MSLVEQNENVEEVEQFEGFSPEGSPPSNDDLDSFDSQDAIELPTKEDNSAKTEEKQEVAKKSAGKDDEDDPTQTMDSANELEEKAAAKEQLADSKEEEDGDKSAEGESEDKEEAPKEQPTGKAVRFKSGDDSIDLDENATVAVKVDGKKQFVPVKELMSNYSGNQSWDKKFQDHELQKNTFNKERDSFESDKKEVVERLGRVGTHINDIFRNPEADPAEALRYLVDIGGHDVLKYEQRMLEHYGQLALDYNDMDEAEQKLYWSEKKNQILLDRQTNQTKLTEDRKADEDRVNQDVEVRRQYGVNDKQFEEAQTQMISLGYDTNDLSAERVCEFIAIVPFAEKAEDVCGQFREELGDDEMVNLISATTQVLRANDYLEPEEAVKLAGRKLGFQIEDINDDISSLNKKVVEPKNQLSSKGTNPKKVGKTRDDDHVESFDDYESDQFNYG